MFIPAPDKSKPDCVGSVRYRTGSGIVNFYFPVTDCLDPRLSDIPAFIDKYLDIVIFIYIYVHGHVYIQMCVCTYTYMYTFIHTYIYI
jgi:hypothetical protein